MANYRPKSLNELNNLYDKSLEAENEIKKSSSKLEEDEQTVDSAFSEQEESSVMVKKTPEQLAADELAEKVDSFAKSFGKSEVNKNPITIATVQSRPRQQKKKTDEAKSGEKNENEAKESAKPKLVRNSERSKLFENYKKVMNDEDDYNFAEPEKDKGKGKRNKSSKKADSDASVQQAVEEAFGADGLNSVLEAEIQKESTVEQKLDADSLNFILKADTKDENTGKAQPEGIISEDFDILSEDKPEETEVESVSTEKKNPGVQILFMALLFVVLMFSVTVGCIKAFSGINEDNPFMDKYQLYSAQSTCDGSQVKKGDLVIVENAHPSPNDTVAYKVAENVYGFARFESVLNSESIIANDNGEQIVVLDSEFRGVVTKTVPVLGSVFAIMSDYFLPIIALLLLICALLVLLVFFSSRKSERAAVIDDGQEEQSLYELDAQQQEEEDYSDSQDEAYDDLAQADEEDEEIAKIFE